MPIYLCSSIAAVLYNASAYFGWVIFISTFSGYTFGYYLSTCLRLYLVYGRTSVSYEQDSIKYQLSQS